MKRKKKLSSLLGAVKIVLQLFLWLISLNLFLANKM